MFKISELGRGVHVGVFPKKPMGLEVAQSRLCVPSLAGKQSLPKIEVCSNEQLAFRRCPGCILLSGPIPKKSRHVSTWGNHLRPQLRIIKRGVRRGGPD